MKNNDITESTTRLLTKLGIPSNLYGYDYLRLAIKYVYEHPGEKIKITKHVYPYIAKIKNKNPKTIESLIRKAIEISYVRANYEILHDIFGNITSPNKPNPTNKEYIYTIVDKMRLGLINI